MNNIREIVLDTETTGLETTFGHRIIEIGAVEMVNKIKTGKVFQTYLNPLREVSNDAYQVHGISTNFLKNKPLFKDIVKDLIEFVGNSKLVIHNAPFDIKFLKHEFSLAKIQGLDLSGCIDTLAIAKKMFPGAKVSLDALCKRFKVDNSNRQFHGALKDALLLADVYLELCGGRQNTFTLNNENNSTNHHITSHNKKYTTPVITPDENESKFHHEFVKKIL